MTTTTAAAAPRASMTSEGRTRLVTGLTASGRLHIGNYVGAVRPLLDLTAGGATEALCFVADLHAMTTDHDPGRLRDHTRELAATLARRGRDKPAQRARPRACSRDALQEPRRNQDGRALGESENQHRHGHHRKPHQRRRPRSHSRGKKTTRNGSDERSRRV